VQLGWSSVRAAGSSLQPGHHSRITSGIYLVFYSSVMCFAFSHFSLSILGIIRFPKCLI